MLNLNPQVMNDPITHESSISDEEPFDKIDAWFINPIRRLKEIRTYDLDGAFLAMSASLAMYERFLIKLAQSWGCSLTDTNRHQFGSVNLGISEKDFRDFWDCYRNGLQHQFQPKKKAGSCTYRWSISCDFAAIPKVTRLSDKVCVIEIDPWKFAELVNSRYDANSGFWDAAKSHAVGIIFESSGYHQSHESIHPLAADPSISPRGQADDYQKQKFQTGASQALPRPSVLESSLD